MIQVNWHPGRQELRGFGVVMVVALGLIGLIKCLWPWEPLGFAAALFSRNLHVGLVFLAVALVVGVPALFGSRLSLPFYWAWMVIALVVGSIVFRLLIGAFYFGLITPMGLFMRLVGRDRLRLKKRESGSYWCDVKPVTDKARYERQF